MEGEGCSCTTRRPAAPRVVRRSGGLPGPPQSGLLGRQSQDRTQPMSGHEEMPRAIVASSSDFREPIDRHSPCVRPARRPDASGGGSSSSCTGKSIRAAPPAHPRGPGARPLRGLRLCRPRRLHDGPESDLLGLPAIRGLSNFHETTSGRTSTSRAADPGVWFFSLDAANGIAVRLARLLDPPPVLLTRRWSSTAEPDRTGWVLIEDHLSLDRRGRWPGPVPPDLTESVDHVTGPADPAWPGTLEHFLTERYFLDAAGREPLLGTSPSPTLPPPGRKVPLLRDETLLAAMGIVRPVAAPIAHFAGGVDVEVFSTCDLSGCGSLSGAAGDYPAKPGQFDASRA